MPTSLTLRMIGSAQILMSQNKGKLSYSMYVPNPCCAARSVSLDLVLQVGLLSIVLYDGGIPREAGDSGIEVLRISMVTQVHCGSLNEP